MHHFLKLAVGPRDVPNFEPQICKLALEIIDEVKAIAGNFSFAARGDFLIITERDVGSFVRPRLEEIDSAIVWIEQQLGN